LRSPPIPTPASPAGPFANRCLTVAARNRRLMLHGVQCGRQSQDQKATCQHFCQHVGIVIRTQVQLTESQMKALRQASADTGKSVAELIRQGVDLYLAGRNEPSREERIKRAIRAAGRFSSGLTDVSVNHDKYLTEAYLQTGGKRAYLSTHPGSTQWLTVRTRSRPLGCDAAPDARLKSISSGGRSLMRPLL
jgi:hypothetical protein